MASGAKHPVTLLTGFLGSGKTTLLARLLGHPELADTAVIVNELGEVAIDHHLLRRVDERTVVLANGCVCCVMRGDLSEELRDLFSKRVRYEIPDFRRVVVETTGLADPAPIVYTLLSEPVVRHHFELDTVVTTVDAVNALDQLERQPEWAKQAAVADRLVVTKSELVDADALDAVERRLAEINPTARVHRVSFGDVEPRELLDGPGHDPREVAFAEPVHSGHVHSFAIFLDDRVDWTVFGIWLTMLLAARGQDLLRVKGLLDVGEGGPLVLNGVQHVVHPPYHLDGWPDDDRRSRLVFIGRGISKREVERSLAAFMRLA